MKNLLPIIVALELTTLMGLLVGPSEARPPSQIYDQRISSQTSKTSSYIADEADPLHSLFQEGGRMLQADDFNSSIPAMKLRRDLLEDYDRGEFPFEWAWNQSENPEEFREGLAVEIGINFHKIFSVDVQKSLVDLVVWFRLSWTDPRLRWNPEDYGNSTSTWFVIKDGSGPAGETSEIWTPDIELWNLEHSLQDTLTDTSAIVSSDGSVFWSRPGHLRAVCKFEGLEEFPFDSLSCKIEFGSWSYSGLYIRPMLMNGNGYSIGGSETSGEAYAEFTLQDVKGENYIYPPFPGDPEQDWPVIIYDIMFERAWQPYARGYLVVQIMLNLIGFCCFWIPPHVGERMSLAITSMLAAVASELVIASNLPQAPEFTWFAKFTLGSTMFAVIVIFESGFVIYFTYHVGKDLCPRWLKDTIQLCTGKKFWDDDDDSSNDDDSEDQEVEQPKRETNIPTKQGGRFSSTEELSVATDDGGGEKKNPSPSEKKALPPSILISSKRREEVEENTVQRKSIEFIEDISKTLGVRTPLKEPDKDDNDSFDRFEPSSRDNDTSLNNDMNDSAGPLRGSVTRSVQISHPDSSPPASPTIPRQRPSKFTLASAPAQFTQSTKQGFKAVMGRDADDFRNVGEMMNNYRWQKIAKSIDGFSRVFFPVAYAIFLVVVFTAGI